MEPSTIPEWLLGPEKAKFIPKRPESSKAVVMFVKEALFWVR